MCLLLFFVWVFGFNFGFKSRVNELGLSEYFDLFISLCNLGYLINYDDSSI